LLRIRRFYDGIEQIVMRRPDDWHVHFRDGDKLTYTVPPVSHVFGRAVAMPNLKPPVTAVKQAVEYRHRLLTSSVNPSFNPLPSLYLTDKTSIRDIEEMKSAGLVAVKLYPAHATTNSEAGVTDIFALSEVLDAMSDLGIILQVHGETVDEDCDVFDREKRFVRRVLDPICVKHPELKVVLEHVTSREGIEFVKTAGDNVAATVTPHHLEIDRNHLFSGGMRPHLYCLPIPKTAADRETLLDTVMGGHPKFFLGSDSAPHPRHAKENACCAAGVYCGSVTISHYAEIFERHGALDRLEAFSSEFGADFYGFPRNLDTITLERRPFVMPTSMPFGDDEVVPYKAGEKIAWRVV
jgi:dihydroorotase